MDLMRTEGEEGEINDDEKTITVKFFIIFLCYEKPNNKYVF